MLFLNKAFDSDFFDPKELQFLGFCEVSVHLYSVIFNAEFLTQNIQLFSKIPKCFQKISNCCQKKTDYLVTLKTSTFEIISCRDESSQVIDIGLMNTNLSRIICYCTEIIVKCLSSIIVI